MGTELSIVIPTFNERDNVRELVRRLDQCLGEIDWEVIFVDDDSPDGTARTVRELAQQHPRVRCLQRLGRRGLTTACVEGMLASSAPYLAVMDGDLQHDEQLLPEMLAHLKRDELDVVIGSRYIDGADAVGLSADRLQKSLLATRLSRRLVPSELKDPMSGFFMLRRSVLDQTVRRLSGIGFKILLDIFASSPTPLKFAELPYRFRERAAGQSKLDNQAAWEYLMLLLDKLIGDLLPVRFVAFLLVGSTGVVVHMAVLALLLQALSQPFVVAQSVATLVAMTSNFALNNFLTYHDRRLRGSAWWRGWLSFCIVCSVGAIANVGVASYLFSQDTMWALAGLAGVLVGVVWNYVVTREYTWQEGVQRHKQAPSHPSKK